MNAPSHHPYSRAGICVWINGLIVLFLAVYFLILPGFILVHDLMDPNLRQPGGIPRMAWRVHASLTPHYEHWARARVASGRAGHLQLNDVPSTEWPMFGSVFYLAATENLQRAWDKGEHGSRIAPKVYARAAIEAAAELILDPIHHTWVRTHWGPNYLHHENVFFRAMIIQGLTCRQNLIGDGKYLDILRDQVETLADDLDRSPYGLLHDYPGECYPVDVLAAITMIRRADPVLGTDHSAFAGRARRGFQGARLDARGLPPYVAEPTTGGHDGISRGIGNSYICIYAPELYPDLARVWYDAYQRYFWQERIGAAGFREYPNDLPGYELFFDVDSGPVIFGFSPAGNAYGLAAARVNGRFDQAWPLASQVLAACWHLPNGSLLGPRMLSNAAHAPYLGEANMLFLLTQNPIPAQPIRLGGHMPPLVYVGFMFYFGLGTLVIGLTTRKLFAWKNTGEIVHVPFARIQLSLWLLLMLAGIILMICISPGIGMLPIITAQLLPRFGKVKRNSSRNGRMASVVAAVRQNGNPRFFPLGAGQT
ncbi:MAG: hypothetical protein KKG09_09075 [Verrucomicrobia bacterium]|nr:hypothetical protein [Verrucomicrobiota bacterium]MBU4291104.1 hypothetical protein [Verrucomicrobiota bacterium]MBU4429907.1 hypothetical protein [Verrucomicrobiota bacterium]MBU4498141.1 hypothetical protein [Verrucomicrobiota bacterium]MCG2680121.1 hypothetical protein [Kiritimatiellia bacterium]